MADRLAERRRKVSARERLGLVILAVVVVGFLGSRAVFRAQAGSAGKGRAEWLALRQQVEAVRAELPDLEAERRQLPQRKAENEALQQELDRAERTFISIGELGRLVGELARQGEGLSVTFESIKQQLREDPEQPEVTIDVTFTAPYEALVNYLRRIERLSPYLRLARLEVTEPKEGPRTVGKTAVTLVAPLAPSSGPGGLAAAVALPPLDALPLPRSPFVSKLRPVEDAAKPSALKVTGITWRGPESTAIINEEVVRVGDTVDSLVVQQILPDKVIVSDGMESHTLLLEAPQ